MKDIHTQRGKLRLPRAAYANTKAIFSVTFCTRDRRHYFANRDLAQATADVVVEHAVRHDVVLHGYCVMPDHVHAIVTPSKQLDVVHYVGQVKNLAQRACWDAGVVGLIWQPRFWDRYVRRSDDGRELYEHLVYVLFNPVRQGIVAVWDAYSFSASRHIPRPQNGGQAPDLHAGGLALVPPVLSISRVFSAGF